MTVHFERCLLFITHISIVLRYTPIKLYTIEFSKWNKLCCWNFSRKQKRHRCFRVNSFYYEVVTSRQFNFWILLLFPNLVQLELKTVLAIFDDKFLELLQKNYNFYLEDGNVEKQLCRIGKKLNFLSPCHFFGVLLYTITVLSFLTIVQKLIEF